LEILALLLLGLIAMLAIVPPIIRGKLDESPLSTTQSFQRSMQEMANSIENGAGREESRGGGGGRRDVAMTAGSGYGGRVHNTSARISSRRKAAVRRNRIMASLTVFAAVWGATALVSGKAWCLIAFSVVCAVLAVFWGLSLIMPYVASRPSAANRRQEAPRSHHRQAV